MADMGWIITRQDGSTAWIQDEAQARAYAADVGGTVAAVDPVIVELTPADPVTAEPGTVPAGDPIMSDPVPGQAIPGDASGF